MSPYSRNHQLTAFGESRSVSAWAQDTRCSIDYHADSIRAGAAYVGNGVWRDEDDRRLGAGAQGGRRYQNAAVATQAGLGGGRSGGWTLN